jgi:hypothetical protein
MTGGGGRGGRGQLRLHKTGANTVVAEITSSGGNAAAVHGGVAKVSDSGQ